MYPKSMKNIIKEFGPYQLMNKSREIEMNSLGGVMPLRFRDDCAR